MRLQCLWWYSFELRCSLAQSTKTTRAVGEALLQQCLAGNKCYRAGERITEPAFQGEEGRVGNNLQVKKIISNMKQVQASSVEKPRRLAHRSNSSNIPIMYRVSNESMMVAPSPAARRNGRCPVSVHAKHWSQSVNIYIFLSNKQHPRFFWVQRKRP